MSTDNLGNENIDMAVGYSNGYKQGYEQGKKDAVKHGHWEEELVDHGCRYLCSECGYVSMQSYGCIAFGDKYNYCPNCGAKMDEK